mmetsp:Transcript_25357/g.34878  ORF Transcript_25357/g.34878 Transcript_25357/m.34878 type:complete len:80 (+) Transcript_25357:645-884(+)
MDTDGELLPAKPNIPPEPLVVPEVEVDPKANGNAVTAGLAVCPKPDEVAAPKWEVVVEEEPNAEEPKGAAAVVLGVVAD